MTDEFEPLTDTLVDAPSPEQFDAIRKDSKDRLLRQQVEEQAQKDYQDYLAQHEQSKLRQLVQERYIELINSSIDSGALPRGQTFSDVVDARANNALQNKLNAYFDRQAEAIATQNFEKVMAEMCIEIVPTTVDGKSRVCAAVGKPIKAKLASLVGYCKKPMQTVRVRHRCRSRK